LILAVALLRIHYLSSDCPLDLAPDEAHYWDWSRHLDWSYYSKGPLVAYSIRAGRLLAGVLSHYCHDAELVAVRLPALVYSSLLLVSLYVLTAMVYGREPLALATVAVALTSPLMSAGASLITIDSPYTCCWGWALIFGYLALFRRVAWAWPVAGLLIGLGILAKYTMVLWLPSLLLFLLSTRSRRRVIYQSGFWLMIAVAAAACLPIIVWNLQHDWVSVRHVSGQAGLGNHAVRWWGPFEYVGVQFALLLGLGFVAWIAAMVKARPWIMATDSSAYLWWMSAPMFCVFLIFSLKTACEPNWPVTAYISGLVLATAWLADQLRSPSRAYRGLLSVGVVVHSLLGIALTVLVHHSAWCQPVLARISGPPTSTRPLPLRRFDPTCRLRGWKWFAAEIDRLRDQLRREGIEPVLAGASWTLPGELGFYCTGNPTVYSVGLALGDRHSQYDLWRPNPVGDPQHFLGKTFILVGTGGRVLRQAFAFVEPSQLITYEERGQPIAQWTVTVCHGFRGFPQLPDKLTDRRF
jgi:4-amino-4-deoxy-L-arabinose transferase-like glycosyltransferase